ncbi:hypothetical protein [Streptomyces sp. TRM64462]|uniref:hypothetical protein n=1 Tax=Streptomyces sp. TRM64462 TaxID=2741726 RepID=UPI001585DA68|nr:hypothetical protein [Streptomyces sp. TRM64462]
MTAATFTHSTTPPATAGATALSAARPALRPALRLGDALRAARVFATAAFGVAILGEYDAQAAGVVRRR